MKRFLIAITIVAFANGCTTVAREAGYPGGNLGFLADRHSVFAKGQKQQINRYILALALLAPLVSETVEGSSEAKLSAERIHDLYGNILKLEKASQSCTLPKANSGQPDTPIKLSMGNCSEEKAQSQTGSALSFETLSFEVARSLNGALKQTYDNLEIRANSSRVLALEPTEMFKTILKTRHFVPVILRYLSTYRDVSIVFGLSIAESCDAHKGTDGTIKPKNLGTACKDVTDSYAALINRTRTADTDVARQERPISDLFKAGKKALDAGLDWNLTKLHRAALIYHVNRACKKLDALAKIDYEDFTGCTVPLATDPKTPARKAEDAELGTTVEAIIANGTPSNQ